MKITILAIGKKHDPALETAILDYTERIGRSAQVTWRIIAADDQNKEHQSIRDALEKLSPDWIVMLDERGKMLSTVDLATTLEKKMVEGIRHAVFVIGGAYGLSDELRAGAHMVWSLSKLTFPHQLVRLVLVEALARAFSVLRGEPYHHA